MDIKDLLLYPDFLLPVVLGCGILLSVFAWKEWQGKWTKYVATNLCVASLGIVMLAMLVLQPIVYKEVHKKGIVLTEGYAQGRLDSLSKNKGDKVIRYEPGMRLRPLLDSLDQVVILGFGVHPTDFYQFNDVQVNYVAKKPPKGIVELNYEKKPTVGDSLIVKALLNDGIAGNHIFLEDAGGNSLDSLRLRGSSDTLVLKAKLPVAGQFVYKIVEKDSLAKVLMSQPLPLDVRQPDHLKIVFVNRFPSFETKYLKNFLAGEKHEVIVRTQITRNKYKFEYLNTSRVPLYGFPEQLLQELDLLILDTDTYLSLSKTEKATIEKTMSEDGLGLFVQPDSRLFSYRSSVLSNYVKQDGKGSFKVFGSTKTIQEKYPYHFNSDAVVAAPQLGSGGYFVQRNNGKIGTTVLKDTYQLLLKGKKSVYQKVWTQLIHMMVKNKEASISFETASDFAYMDFPHPITLHSDEVLPEIGYKDGYQLSFIQNPSAQYRWHTATYPPRHGWNLLGALSDSVGSHAYYVMEDSQWRPLRQIHKLKANKRFFQEKVGKGAISKKMKQPISSFWFLLILMCCLGYLWLQPKILAQKHHEQP